MKLVSLGLLGLVLAAGLAFTSVGAQEEEHQEEFQLSPQLMEVLRTEMRALLAGVQSLPAGMAMGDWERIAETSARISSSYILEQKLTSAQREELATALPDYFKRLDAAFHREADKLGAAAMDHDAQLAAFHYYRLMETCISCHSAYAVSRFPGFAADGNGGHGQ
jgi:cytochrome c556